jgi:uncharacterized membrane protein
MSQRRWLKSLQRSFVTGLILLAPMAATVWVINFLLTALEPVTPALSGGLLVTFLAHLIPVVVIILIILLVGWLSRTALGGLASMVTDFVSRLPVLGLVYSSVRDLVNAVSGEERRFQHPVWVKPIANSPLRFIGFITREDLAMLGAKGDVAVYLPHSYNISGNLIIVPRRVVRPIKTKSADLFAFVATGGMSGAHGHHGGRGR